jgi:hypothetical protein
VVILLDREDGFNEKRKPWPLKTNP